MKISREEAMKEAREIVKTVDLEEGETKKQWCETYLEALKEDGLIKVFDEIKVVKRFKSKEGKQNYAVKAKANKNSYSYIPYGASKFIIEYNAFDKNKRTLKKFFSEINETPQKQKVYFEEMVKKLKKETKNAN